MLRALPYYVLLILCAFLLGFYLENYQPQTMTVVLMKLDVFGWSQSVRKEQQRLYAIDNLTVTDESGTYALPYEKKQVLINGKVFMGATAEMVKLALGEPMKTASIQPLANDGKKINQVVYVYYLPNEKRPTFFVFRDNVLKDAYKGSVLDVDVR